MKKKKQTKNNWKFPKRVFFVFFLCMIILFARFCYLSLSKTVNGHNIQEFAKNRNTVSKTLRANRGTIYDVHENTLAQNVTSYTLIAYLDKKRKRGNKIDYVKDIDSTAKALAEVLQTDENDIKNRLNKGKEDKKYQIEIGNAGRNITELKKGQIDDLSLPGIDFIHNYKRYYPNGDFASYILGYAKANEKKDKDGKTTEIIEGELGIEAKYDNLLKGTDGYLQYQQDRLGYKIPDTAETRIEAINGSDIYLTLDSGIQRFAETEVKAIEEKYKPEWSIITVMDAKNGDILASASTPSFNPNNRDVKNYENLLVTTAFEPGSTMKIYTYMCAIEKGTYDGNATFRSGTIEVTDATIKDWNNVGWGTISYDKGFEYSSNVGISTMMGKFINKNDLRDCLNKYGFGKTTGIDIARESAGKLGFKYPVEVANAGFGQGINTTVIQHLHALSIISNNGKALTPHVVSKIVNTNTGRTTYKRKIEESEEVASTKTIEKIKELMYNVVNSEDDQATGKRYHIDDYEIIGKTGTAQIASPKGGYLKGESNYIYSFAGMYPKDNPEVIIYAAVKKPNIGATVVVSDGVNNIMRNIAKYRNMFSGETINKSDIALLKLDSFTNKKTETIKKLLEDNRVIPIIIGSGDKIINQFPSKGEKVLSYDKVILVTNNDQNKMPSLKDYSRSEAIYLMNALGFKYEIDGYGYVIDQSIKEGQEVKENDIIKITLSQKYEQMPN
ncbi:MAG: penicillin-binding protein [Bacilli bacterium]|nr:penicillin-binding protein [Bacilli bacterium]